METGNRNLEPRGKGIDSHYVWHNAVAGPRVIVVVDDDITVLSFIDPADPFPKLRDASQLGLEEVFVLASEWPDTRAIGFFPLPSRVEEIDKVLRPMITNWIEEICSPDTADVEIYCLLDVMHSNSAAEMKAMGKEVCRRFFEEPFHISEMPVECTTGFLSQTGASFEAIKEDPFFAEHSFMEFRKERIAESVKNTKLLPNTLMKWLGRDVRSCMSEWELEEWQLLRQQIREVCQEIGNGNDVYSFSWAHHLPHGGEYSDAPEAKERAEKMTQELRQKLCLFMPLTDTLPDHSWEENGGRQTPSWERPPIRALAQVDSRACKDLSTLISLVAADVEHIGNIQLVLSDDLTNTIPKELNFLWFNGSALARGLYQLAEGFFGATGDGRIECKISFSKDDGDLQVLTFVIREYKQSVQSDSGVVMVPIPNLQTAKEGSLTGARKHFERAGARWRVTEGRLILEIAARKNGGYWEVESWG